MNRQHRYLRGRGRTLTTGKDRAFQQLRTSKTDIMHPVSFGCFNDMYINNAGTSTTTLQNRYEFAPWCLLYYDLTDETVLDTDFGVFENRKLDYLWVGSFNDTAAIPANGIVSGGSTTTQDNWLADNIWLPGDGSDEEQACIDFLTAGGTIVVGAQAKMVFSFYDNGAGTATLITECQNSIDDYNTFLTNIGSETTLQTWLDAPEYDGFYASSVDGTEVWNPKHVKSYQRSYVSKMYDKIADDDSLSGSLSLPISYSKEIHETDFKHHAFWYNADADTHLSYQRVFQTRFTNSSEYSAATHNSSQYGPYYEFTHKTNTPTQPEYQGSARLFPLSIIESVGGGTVIFLRPDQVYANITLDMEYLIDRAEPSATYRQATQARYSDFGTGTHNSKKYTERAAGSVLRHSRPTTDGLSVRETQSTGDTPVAFTATGNLTLHIETPATNTGNYLAIAWQDVGITADLPLYDSAEHSMTWSATRDVQYAEAHAEIQDLITKGILSSGAGTYSRAGGHIEQLQMEKVLSSNLHRNRWEAPFAPTCNAISTQGVISLEMLRRNWDGVSYGSVQQRIRVYSMPVIYQDGKVYGNLSAKPYRTNYTGPSITLPDSRGYTLVPLASMKDITDISDIKDGTPDLTPSGSLFAVGRAFYLTGLMDNVNAAGLGQAYQLNAINAGHIDISQTYSKSTLQAQFDANTSGLTVETFGV